jgi:hypothetical protein
VFMTLPATTTLVLARIAQPLTDAGAGVVLVGDPHITHGSGRSISQHHEFARMKRLSGPRSEWASTT